MSSSAVSTLSKYSRDSGVKSQSSILSIKISNENDENVIIHLTPNKRKSRKNGKKRHRARSRRQAAGGDRCKCGASGYGQNLYRSTFGPTIDETILVGLETFQTVCNENDSDSTKVEWGSEPKNIQSNSIFPRKSKSEQRYSKMSVAKEPEKVHPSLHYSIKPSHEEDYGKYDEARESVDHRKSVHPEHDQRDSVRESMSYRKSVHPEHDQRDSVRESMNYRKSVHPEYDQRDSVRESMSYRKSVHPEYDQRDSVRESMNYRNSVHPDYDQRDSVRESMNYRNSVHPEYDQRDSVRESMNYRNSTYPEYDQRDSIRESTSYRNSVYPEYEQRDSVRESMNYRNSVYPEYEEPNNRESINYRNSVKQEYIPDDKTRDSINYRNSVSPDIRQSTKSLRRDSGVRQSLNMESRDNFMSRRSTQNVDYNDTSKHKSQEEQNKNKTDISTMTEYTLKIKQLASKSAQSCAISTKCKYTMTEIRADPKKVPSTCSKCGKVKNKPQNDASILKKYYQIQSTPDLTKFKPETPIITAYFALEQKASSSKSDIVKLYRLSFDTSNKEKRNVSTSTTSSSTSVKFPKKHISIVTIQQDKQTQHELKVTEENISIRDPVPEWQRLQSVPTAYFVKESISLETDKSVARTKSLPSARQSSDLETTSSRSTESACDLRNYTKGSLLSYSTTSTSSSSTSNSKKSTERSDCVVCKTTDKSDRKKLFPSAVVFPSGQTFMPSFIKIKNKNRILCSDIHVLTINEISKSTVSTKEDTTENTESSTFEENKQSTSSKNIAEEALTKNFQNYCSLKPKESNSLTQHKIKTTTTISLPDQLQKFSTREQYKNPSNQKLKIHFQSQFSDDSHFSTSTNKENKEVQTLKSVVSQIVSTDSNSINTSDYTNTSDSKKVDETTDKDDYCGAPNCLPEKKSVRIIGVNTTEMLDISIQTSVAPLKIQSFSVEQISSSPKESTYELDEKKEKGVQATVQLTATKLDVEYLGPDFAANDKVKCLYPNTLHSIEIQTDIECDKDCKAKTDSITAEFGPALLGSEESQHTFHDMNEDSPGTRKSTPKLSAHKESIMPEFEDALVAREFQASRQGSHAILQPSLSQDRRSSGEEVKKRNAAPTETRYAITRVTKYDDFTTYEVLKSTKAKPKIIPCITEGVFIVKNKDKKQ